MTSPEFSKSAHCGDGACAEVAFVRSTVCSDSACLEMGTTPDTVLLRNSTDPGTVADFDKAAWRAFLADVRNGEFSV